MSTASKHTGDRRPIAVRKWSVFQRLAEWLVRRGVSPNTISIAGMLGAIAAGAALAATSYLPTLGERLAWLATAFLIQLRLLANMLDGMVAIEGGRGSAVGELYNEVPDRVSDAAVLIGAGYAVGGDVALGYIAACVALFTAYVRAMGKAAGAQNEFCGPMAKQQRMFIVTVIAVYNGLAPTAWRPTANGPYPWGLMAGGLVLIVLGGVVTILRRLLRIAGTLKKAAP
jgi:phosphatidylglycerophosphate synthase